MFSDKRYTALPILIGFLRLMGALPLFGAILFFVTGAYTAVSGNGPTGTVIMLGVFFALLFVAVLLFGAGEALQVLMDIEENTRRQADDAMTSAAAAKARSYELATQS